MDAGEGGGEEGGRNLIIEILCAILDYLWSWELKPEK